MQRLAATMTPDEFLAWEREQPGRHHYVRGAIFDMSGGSMRHNTLGAELAATFATAVRAADCRTFSPDQKIGVADDLFVYADCSVACPPFTNRSGAKDVLTNPVVIVEVLSKSTESYDRGDKLRDYLSLASVQYVLLVSQQAVRIDLFRREPKGAIQYETFGAGDTITLTHPSVTLSLDALYRGVFDLLGDE
jgi:Uma2 family endonuclease